MISESIQWFFQRGAEYSLESFSSWESFRAAIIKVPQVFTDFSHGFAWPYLLSSLASAWILFVFARNRGGMQAVSFREFAFPGWLYRHPSARLDCRFVAIDIVLFFLLYLPIIAGINLSGCKIMSALIVRLMSWEPPSTLSPVAAVGAAVGFLMLSDFINYCAHVCFHRIPVLWSIHRIHHSAEVLTPMTAYRVHPLELIGFALCNAPAIGLASVFYQNTIGPPLQVATIFGISIIGLVGSHLRHSHIVFSFGPWLSRIVLSPAQHVIHHSVHAKHWNKNYGVKFAFWDMLLGTLYVPSGNEPVSVGLQDPGAEKFRTVGDLYLRPFRDVFAGRALSAERRA